MTEGTHSTLDPVTSFAAISRTLTESLELSDVLRRIAAEAHAMTGSDGVSILLRRGDIVEFVAHETTHGSKIPVGYRLEIPDGLASILAEQRDPLLVPNLHESPLIPQAIKDRIFVRDLIIVPLWAGEDLLGALILAFRSMPGRWAGEDRVLLRALGDQAAIAVRNARLYEEARRSNERLIQAEKLSALGRLLARVAHELNNPLTTIRLHTELLEAESLPGDASEHARAISRETEFAAAIVGDLLRLARKREGRRETVPLDEIVAEAVASQERRIAAVGAKLDLHVPGGLPPVHADPRGLRHVLSNLIRNAAQTLQEQPTQNRTIVIRATAGAAGAGSRDLVTVEVEDSGPGVPDAMKSRIFEPFFTTKPVGEGTGLGLPIVKEIVEEHGGEIEVADAEGGGAVFRFAIPAAKDVQAGEPSTPAEPEPGPSPAGLRVLVIDDEAGLQRALGHVLRRLGCEVTAALTAEEAFEAVRRHRFDLILCDIHIPGSGGREIHARLREAAPELIERLVFMTGDALTDEVRDLIRSTGRPRLPKPFGRAQLVKLLQDIPGARMSS